LLPTAAGSDQLSSHDYNSIIRGIPGIQPFRDLFPEAYNAFAAALIKYIEHIMEATSQAGAGTVESQPVRQTWTGPELPKDDKGYPLLPPAPTGNKKESLQGQKDLVRTFIVMHYREFQSVYRPLSKTETFVFRLCLQPRYSPCSMETNF